MSKVIAIANTSGGVGKTTTAHAIAACIVDYGKSVLLIDLDPKADLTFRLGRENDRTSISDYLSKVQITESALEKTQERFSFIGSDSRINNIDDLNSLKNLIDTQCSAFDVVVLDLPSTISPSLAIALRVADLVLIPTRNTLHAIRGAHDVLALVTNQNVYGLQIGELQTHDLGLKFIDAHILFGEEVEQSEEGNYSVVTANKECAVSESFRDASYSVLEVLGLV